MSPVYSTLVDWCRALFGVYTPVTYRDASGLDIVPAGLSGVNIEYVAQVVLFSLVLFFLFRLLASLLSPRR